MLSPAAGVPSSELEKTIEPALVWSDGRCLYRSNAHNGSRLWKNVNQCTKKRRCQFRQVDIAELSHFLMVVYAVYSLYSFLLGKGGGPANL
jgi:hypothetical protein